ncbi:MAG TPA: hypothetical protein VN733_07385, partial [Solirubrobacterales bacterium]|nr:hypothetical protein [Solirubrobacterales bacterium]
LDMVPLLALGQKLPSPVRWALRRTPSLRPVLPDPGVRFQLVHHDDVARAMAAAICGDGPPGAYNLAGEGEVGVGDIARQLGWRSVPLPGAAVNAAAAGARRLTFASSKLEWATALDTPVLMDTAKARRDLGWKPQHDARETLRETVAGAREKGLLD